MLHCKSYNKCELKKHSLLLFYVMYHLDTALKLMCLDEVVFVCFYVAAICEPSWTGVMQMKICSQRFYLLK